MRVFISHSSRNNSEAIAVKQWLIANERSLAEEIFLDLDSDTGIRPGQRWKEALRQASNRCEAVICLLSAHWEDSPHCKTEYLYAEDLRKTIFVARLEPCTRDSITSEWQHCDLFADGADIEPITLDSRETVKFAKDGLHRLLNGLRALGIGADYFPWPPPEDIGRMPYRGWASLDMHDAAVFFGRDAQIVRGLDVLRGMRVDGVESMLVIQGPSGAGKSAFLRAGLLPRLQRDDRRFLPLEVVRPERAVLTGERGLASAIDQLRRDLGLTGPVLGDIKDACRGVDVDRLRGWLEEARQTAQSRLLDVDPGQPAPTLVLPLDQGEELFFTSATPEAAAFLQIVCELLRARDGVTPAMLMVVTIRADSYEPLHTAPQLTGVGSKSFNDLKEMPPAQFKEVITGPAKRATDAGQPLAIEEALTERLLKDCPTADGLALLALTLERLYTEFGSDGNLTLAEYERMGGLKHIVQTEVTKILSDDLEQRNSQLDVLHKAFIPALATINLDNDRPGRRIARLKDLPEESHELLENFVEKRLLVKKTRGGQVCVEVALESLLRQWKELARWLRTESQDLKFAERIQLSAREWKARGRDEHDLVLRGTRLIEAEKLAGRKRYFSGSDNPTHDFLRACRQREDERADEEQRRHAEELRAAHEKQETAERHATEMTKSRFRTLILALFAVLVAVLALVGFVDARHARNDAQASRNDADKRFHEATALRLVTEAEAMLAGARPDGDFRALQQILAAPLISSPGDPGALLDAVIARHDLRKIIQTGGPVSSVAASADGARIVTGSLDGMVRVWDAATGHQYADIDTGHGFVWSAAFAGPNIVSGSTDGTVQIWDPDTGRSTSLTLSADGQPVRSLAVSADGRYIVSGSVDGTVRVWDTTQQEASEIETGHRGLMSVAISGQNIATGGADGTVQQWSLQDKRRVGLPMTANDGAVWCVTLSPRGDRIAAAGASANVWLWDAADGTRAPTAIPHTGGVWTVAFSPDGDRLVTGGVDDAVRVWDVASGKEIGAPMIGNRGDVKGVAFVADGVVSVGDDGTVRMWNTPDPRPTPPLNTPSPAEVVNLAFDGQQIVSVSAAGTVQWWDADGKPAGPAFPVITGTRSVPVFGTGGATLATGTDHGTVRVWNPVTGQPAGPEIPVPYDKVTALAFGGGRIASRGTSHATAYYVLRQWDATTGAQAGPPVTIGSKRVSAIAVSFDGQRIVVASDGVMRIWDATSGEAVTPPMTGDLDINRNARNIASVAFSEDGQRIVSGSSGDDTVRVWNAVTGEQIGAVMRGHQRDVTSVRFSRDGQYIVSGADDGFVRVWDANNQRPVGHPLQVLQQPAIGLYSVASVAFSPDGQRIVAGLQNGTLRVWPGPAAWSAELCAKLTRNISRRHWNEWVAQSIDYVAACPSLDPQAETDPP